MIAHAKRVSRLQRRQAASRQELIEKLMALMECRRAIRCSAYVHGWDNVRRSGMIALTLQVRVILSRLRRETF